MASRAFSVRNFRFLRDFAAHSERRFGIVLSIRVDNVIEDVMTKTQFTEAGCLVTVDIIARAATKPLQMKSCRFVFELVLLSLT